MKLPQKLNLALERCGFSPLKNDRAYRKVGAGAWHDAYLVYPAQGDRLVIRLRKKVIYGRQEIYAERYLREDYEPVGLYYGQANQCRPGICPEVYVYDLRPDLIFTIESYLGRTMSLPALSRANAFAFGRQVGRFFRAMHARPAPLSGFGDLVWNGRSLEAGDKRPLSTIWQAEIDTVGERLDRLSQTDLSFDRKRVAGKVEAALAGRSFDRESIVLVNGDITPENLISRRRAFAGLVDPVPRLDNGLRYAAFFIYCYKSYLPNLADTPRYARHQFRRQAPLMAVLADGYLDGYVQGDQSLEQQLRLEYFLWGLDVAAQSLKRLRADLDEETRLRAGDKKAIAARLQHCLQELETFRLD